MRHLNLQESMNTQRDIIYKERNRLIKQEGRLDVIVRTNCPRSLYESGRYKDYIVPIAFIVIFLDNVSYQVNPQTSSIIPF